MAVAPFKSEFAIIDVKAGRGALLKRVRKGERPAILISASVDSPHSRDDGISREFGLTVHRVHEGKSPLLKPLQNLLAAIDAASKRGDCPITTKSAAKALKAAHSATRKEAA